MLDLISEIEETNKRTVKRSELLFYKGTALNNKGFLYSRKGEADIGLKYYNLALDCMVQAGNKLNASFIMNNIAGIHKSQGNYMRALEYLYEVFKINDELGDKRGMGNSLSTMAGIYLEQDDTTKARRYFQLSMEYFEESNFERGIGYTYGNLAGMYRRKGDYDKAKELANKGIEILYEVGDENGAAKLIASIGNVYNEQGNSDSALYYFEKAILIYENIGDKRWLPETYRSKANILLERGDRETAKEIVKKSLEMSEDAGVPMQIHLSALMLSQIEKEDGNYKEALVLFERHIKMRDSVNSKESINSLAQKEYQYQYEKKKEKDELEHDKELAIKDANEARQKIVTYAVIGGAALLALFLLVVFNRLKITRKQKQIIENQKEEVELAHEELEEKNQEILDSINYAKRIQSAILPPPALWDQHINDSFVLYIPKDIVAGDFYWMEKSGEEVLFAAADCTGHGVPGAMVSVVCHNALNRSVREMGLTDPGKILDSTREIVIKEFGKSDEEVKDGMDIALCSLNGLELKYAGAHNPLWIMRNGELIEIKADKQPVGKYDQLQPYQTHSIQLESGDTFYIFSDGFADQFGGEKGKKMKSKGFRDMLFSIQDKTIPEQKEYLRNEFIKWRGDIEQLDDVCVIGVRI